MTKAAKESIKPKFQQTKLCFASFTKPTTIVSKKAQDTAVLEKSIKDMNIGNSVELKHQDPCQDCSKEMKRVQCTALRPNTKKACGLSYCTDCVYKKVKEDLEWIESNKEARFVDKNGHMIQYVESKLEVQPKWACPVCRGLCDCELCTKLKQASTHQTKLSFNIDPTSPPNRKKTSTIVNIDPPKLTRIEILYSEQEIWTRLQIREFLFRFGDLYGFDNRILSSLQNVQGDWRIKKFGAYIVWQFLMILIKTSNYDLPLQYHTQENQLLQLARNITDEWIKNKKMDNVYFDRESKYEGLLEVLQSEGMTPKRWQDIGELLAVAEFKEIPVPTSKDVSRKDEDRMEIDQEEYDNEDYQDQLEELNDDIKRYQKSTSRNSPLISTQDELVMINMLLELLLFDVQIRQSLVAAGKNSTTKEIREEEVEFKKYQKEWKEENSKHILSHTSLSNRIYQLEATKGKQAELNQARIDLDALETLIRDDQHNLAKKKLELTIHTLKQEKRLQAIGCDTSQNEYWVFNDILDHLNHATDYRNSEPFWAYGVVMIGPGFSDKQGWWYIQGMEDLKKLRDYIVHQNKKEREKDVVDELKRIASGIQDRIDYLVSLETCVYGEGFFK